MTGSHPGIHRTIFTFVTSILFHSFLPASGSKRSGWLILVVSGLFWGLGGCWLWPCACWGWLGGCLPLGWSQLPAAAPDCVARSVCDLDCERSRSRGPGFLDRWAGGPTLLVWRPQSSEVCLDWVLRSSAFSASGSNNWPGTKGCFLSVSLQSLDIDIDIENQVTKFPGHNPKSMKCCLIHVQ